MAFVPVLSLVPPGPGGSKPLWSPDLFNTSTGDYPKASPPGTVSYPPDSSGRLRFFEGFESADNGAIQCTLAGAAGGSEGYWQGTYQILHASDRSVVAEGTFKLSQSYLFRPLASPPFVLVSERFYTDADWNLAMTAHEGGGDQKVSVPPGDYIVQFLNWSAFTQTAPYASPATGATFSQVDHATVPVMEHTVTVVSRSSAIVNFSTT